MIKIKVPLKYQIKLLFMAIFKPNTLSRNIDAYKAQSGKEIAEIELTEAKEKVEHAAYACLSIYRDIVHSRKITSLKRHCDLLAEYHTKLLIHINDTYYNDCIQVGIEKNIASNILSEIPDSDFIIDFIRHPEKYTVQQIFDSYSKIIEQSRFSV